MTLTKTLRFDEDVQDVLAGMKVEPFNGGFLGVLTCGQLERKLYERTNKALEALGGKWNRKAGGHIFPTDPRQQLNGVVEEGTLTVARDGFFETPRAVVEKMLELAPLAKHSQLILEPSAGMGAILKVLLADKTAKWHMFEAIEKNEQRRQYLEEYLPVKVVGSDFLTYQLPEYSDGSGPMCRYDRIYMNPPFEEGQDIDHVRHAYSLLVKGGQMVSVMSTGAFYRSDHKATAFRKWLEEAGGQTYDLPEGSFKESGTGVNTVLVVICKSELMEEPGNTEPLQL